MRHGSHIDPPNRFEKIRREDDLEQVAWDTEYLASAAQHKIEYIDDDTKTIVTENNSPDIPFRYSVNPYRGCVHGCSYCYARPYHEYLGFTAGIEFETKIIVKRDAASLLRDFLSRDRWQPERIAFSGVTDCYQPAERDFRLTRQCLEVASEAFQPIGVITKNALVVRDKDFLAPMAEQGLACVSVSITTLDAELARAMEPRTSTPTARLRAIRELTTAGVPVRVMVAPIIPGLNDSEIPAILGAAAEAGATSAGYTLLRLPHSVEPIFLDWLERTQPDRAQRVVSRIRQCRDGEVSDSQFGRRMRGSGAIADQIASLFAVFQAKLSLDKKLPRPNTDLFKRPKSSSGQLRLF